MRPAPWVGLWLCLHAALRRTRTSRQAGARACVARHTHASSCGTCRHKLEELRLLHRMRRRLGGTDEATLMRGARDELHHPTVHTAAAPSDAEHEDGHELLGTFSKAETVATTDEDPNMWVLLGATGCVMLVGGTERGRSTGRIWHAHERKRSKSARPRPYRGWSHCARVRACPRSGRTKAHCCTPSAPGGGLTPAQPLTATTPRRQSFIEAELAKRLGKQGGAGGSGGGAAAVEGAEARRKRMEAELYQIPQDMQVGWRVVDWGGLRSLGC